MPTFVMLAALAVGVALPLLGWSVLAGRDPARGAVLENLAAGLVIPEATSSKGTGDARISLARRLTPAGSIKRMDRLLALAGRPPAWPIERLAMAKLVLVVVGAMLGALFIQASPGIGRFVMVVLVVSIAYITPELLLHSRGQERQKAMGLQLADTLDQMTIAVEAGLGFESAMSRAARNGKGPLAEEFIRTLQDIQVGQPRRAAYLALAERTNVPDLRRFLRAVIQADQYGVAIADVLRTQASEMRMKRRQRAEEKAMQIPVKVIFPLMLCILPVLFIVLLGPAAMGIVAAFSGGK